MGGGNPSLRRYMERLEVDLSQHSYAFAIPCYDGVWAVESALSMCNVVFQLSARRVKHTIIAIRGGALIDAVRNELVEKFLEETDCDTMVWIDSDIKFKWEAMERLLAFSSLYPVVSGTYCARTEPTKFIVNALDNKLNEHGLLPHWGTGLGFTAVQRHVYDKIEHILYHNRETPERKRKAYFLTGVDEDGLYVGEDVYFFRSCINAGITPMIDPGIELEHIGTKIYDVPFIKAVNQILGEGHGIQTEQSSASE